MKQDITTMENGGGGGGGSGGSSRWNPTKEQIRVLEDLYKEGIKTPSAEEIQQITARLREYGHIEGKNVFYWFQNHKARQRQKQKQESLAANYYCYFNNHRFLHYSPPSHPISPNAICAPYCTPQPQNTEMGFYPQHPNLLVPVGYRRNPCEKFVPTNGYDGVHEQQRMILDVDHSNFNYNNQETLDLFPLHPTGILEAAKSTQQISSLMPSVENSPSNGSLCVNAVDNNNGCSGNQPFFDFFTSEPNP